MKEEVKMNDLYISGKVVRAFYGTARQDDTEKYRLTIFNENLPYDKIQAFDGSSSKYTPAWFKDAEGYMNLTSRYTIPVKIGSKETDFDNWVNGDYTAPNSKVVVRVRQKQGAVYPVAILVKEDGFVENPFEGFDEEDN